MKTRGVLLLFGLSFVCVGAAEGGPLRVGAARVDITSAPGAANVKTTGRGVDPQRAKGRHLSRTPRRAGADAAVGVQIQRGGPREHPSRASAYRCRVYPHDFISGFLLSEASGRC